MPDPTPHVPTEISRAEVCSLVSFGITHEQIAAHLDICADTLVKYYRRELDTALTTANAKVAKGLFKKATEDEDLGAQIFWLKTRARWRTEEVVGLVNDNEQLKNELKELRAQLDSKNKKEY